MNKHFYSFVILFIFIAISSSLKGQHQEVSEKPEIWKGQKTAEQDTNSLLSAFKSGQIQGHFRYFFSHTNNSEGLSDYYANAAGGGLRFETENFKGFKFGLSGFYIFNIGSSDLTKRDPVTNQINRYELGLFDIENPSNKNDMSRLEELFLKYTYKNSSIKFGRQLINTPFINLQDGRMRPTGVEGVWMEMNEVKKFQIYAGWLYGVSPRSTVNWYSMANSVGVYPPGVNAEGIRSDYPKNINSKGVALAGIEYKWNKAITLKSWNMIFENVIRTHLIQSEIKHKINKNKMVFVGFMYLNQSTIGKGGNDDPKKTYTDKTKGSNVVSSQIGYKMNQLELSANYTHIFGTGRYLMPREWGRDPFYTFLPRERNEGFGNLSAYVGKIAYQIPSKNIKLAAGYGYFRLPDVRNFELNKYGQPSYSQLNIDIKYAFAGVLKGLDAQLLIVKKKNYGNIYNDRKFEINKVNMMLYNLVLNYHF